MTNSEFDQLKMRNEKLSSILEVGKIMSTHNDLDSLLAIIAAETSKILEADRTSIFLYDKNNHELWLKTSEKHEISDIRFSIDKGIAGFVARSKKLMNIENVYEHELFNPEIDQMTGFKTEGMLCAPMENLRGNLIGVIQVLNKKTGLFTEEDIDILIMFTSFAAILLENSILAEENLKKERMSLVGSMAGSIIHDIKNPMTAIKGLAEIIACNSPEYSEPAQVILKSVDRLINMSEELLEFSKGVDHKLAFEEIDSEKFLRETFSFVEQEFTDAGIALKYENNYLGNIFINEDKLQRAIFNITGNAVDAMKGGGTFSVSINESTDNKNVIMSFRDTGKGMPSNIQQTLFEPFITFGKKNGTGLGMAITKKIVDAHLGSIIVDSEEGIGTNIEITLPKTQS